MQEHHLTIPRTARYFMLGRPSASTREVWFVCHGYGQLASYFLEHFDVLEAEPRVVIAPEGLSRFYLEGVTGRIGASWMTREGRLSEITDSVNYLDTIYAQIFDRLNRAEVKVVILGFSQGAATVCRWVDRGSVKCDKLILWAGIIPGDIDLAEKRELFAKQNLTLVVGSHDEFAKPSVLSEQESRLRQCAIPYRLISFDGGHHLEESTLKAIAKC